MNNFRFARFLNECNKGHQFENNSHNEWDCPKCRNKCQKDWHKCPWCGHDFHKDC